MLNEDYATRIAREWNVPAGGVGHVTRFAVRRDYLDAYEVHRVGGDSILEYWIPADELPVLKFAAASDEVAVFEVNPA